jgi:hypothetical protein
LALTIAGNSSWDHSREHGYCAIPPPKPKRTTLAKVTGVVERNKAESRKPRAWRLTPVPTMTPRRFKRRLSAIEIAPPTTILTKKSRLHRQILAVWLWVPTALDSYLEPPYCIVDH